MEHVFCNVKWKLPDSCGSSIGGVAPSPSVTVLSVVVGVVAGSSPPSPSPCVSSSAGGVCINNRNCKQKL